MILQRDVVDEDETDELPGTVERTDGDDTEDSFDLLDLLFDERE